MRQGERPLPHARPAHSSPDSVEESWVTCNSLTKMCGGSESGSYRSRAPSRTRDLQRDSFIDNLLVRIHLIIEMILVDRPCAIGV